MSTTAKYQLRTATETGLIRTGSGMLMAIEIADVDEDHTVILNDSTDGGGSDILKVTSAEEAGGKFMDFSRLGGIQFSTGIYATITSAGGQVFFWIE